MIKALIIAVGLLSLSACAGSDPKSMPTSDKSDTVSNIMTIHGKLSLKGSAPHSYLSIKDIDSNRSYKIQNSSNFGLSKKQDQIVTLKAKLIQDAVGPGHPAVVEVVSVD